MKRSVPGLLLGLIAAPLAAEPAPEPKLIVAISVDQFSSNLFHEYRPYFTGGLKRLAGGVAFADGFQAHAATETCPGHSTILTGAHPARTGIVAAVWVDYDAPREDKAVYCAEDESVPGTKSDEPDICKPKAVGVALPNGRTIGTHRFAREPGNKAAFFLASPEADAATLALAATLIPQLQLGRGPATDLVAISLSATDFVGHRYGSGGVEMCLQLTTLDAELASFFDVLDKTGIDYAVVLTADHGGLDVPEPATSPSEVGTHGSPWDYDRKVPILFWWKGIEPEDRREGAMAVDIMPTLASLIGLPVPAGEIDGRCLDILTGPETNCTR